MRAGRFLFSVRPVLRVIAACLLPWLAVLLLFSTPWVAIHFLVFLILLAGVGYLAMQLIAAPLTFQDILLFSPAVGFVVAGSFTAIAVKHGADPAWTLWGVAVLGLMGTISFARRIGDLRMHGIHNGFAIVILSALICLVYFLPGVLQDAVVKHDGGYQWMYVDTQYSMAVAASVKSGLGSVKMPGLSLADLDYHFGTYALSGTLSAATGVGLGDAYARVIRGISQFIMLLSAIGFGRVLGSSMGGSKFAGLSGALGLFFYGSLSALFVAYGNSSSNIRDAILFEIPFADVLSSGGPFAHFLLGHSVLNGMIGLMAILGVLVIKFRTPDGPRFHADFFSSCQVYLPQLTLWPV